MTSVLPATEFAFVLPRGLAGADGSVHRDGVMRLATARDELVVERARTAQAHPGYGDLVMFARVITRLGNLTEITPLSLEDLFTVDLAYLREFYNRINQSNRAHIPAECPQCRHNFSVDLSLAGEL
ncbi:phage tail assembly protein [Leptolyngbya sp. AN02str]|uniref:phage tail assembly protein n=1 Tax=Leptolyngbya sp. AN02str TaxID=3423363 RepID=UPI003D31043E